MVTGVEVDAVLLPPTSSSVAVEILTLLSTFPPAAAVSGRTTTFTVCCAPEAMLAHEHVSVAPVLPTAGELQVPPPLGERDTNAALAGSVSVICTVLAVEGPLLRAVTT